MRGRSRYRLSEAAIETMVKALDQAPVVTVRRLSLRDVARLMERAEMMEGRPQLQ